MSNIKPIYCYLIIIIVTYSIFYNSLSNEFVFDDDSVILGNKSITDLNNIPKFFTAEDGFHKVIGRYYRPITSTTYALDYNLWGLKPYGFHLTNVIIHIICCLLLFKILTLLFWRYKYRNLFALLSALIFAAHPIHTEAVSWVSGRTDSLVTMFFFASFLFYIEYTKDMKFDRAENSLKTIKENSLTYLILSLLFYTLGLLSKEMIITMPVIILLYDFVYRKKNFEYFKKNFISYASFAVITVGFLLVRYILLKDIPERTNYLYFIGSDVYVVIGTMLKTIPVYFRLLFVPFGLLYHYNGVIPDAKSIIDGAVILSFLFVVFLLVVSFIYYKKDSIVSFCILFFLVTLLPVMNIVPSMNLMAERFLYMTSFGLVLLICHLALLGSAKRDFKFLTIGLIIIICSLSYLTFKRNADWKDNNTLYSSANNVNGSVLLVNSGNILANEKKYNEAAELYKKAIEIRDRNLLAHHNLGLIYLVKGNLDSAEMKFNKGVSIDSLAPDGYYQLANVYRMKDKREDAIKMLLKLQTIYPNYRETENILKMFAESESKDSGKTGSQDNSAIQDEALNLKLNSLQNSSYKNYTEKKYEEAIKDLKELIILSSDSASKSGFLNNIGMCYSEMKNGELEEKYYLEAYNYQKSNVNAMNGLATYYKRTGKSDKAKMYLEKILEINPADENALLKLDSLKAN